MFRRLASVATAVFILGLSPVYSEEILVTTSYIQNVGDQLYALTDGYYSYDDLEGIENYLKKEGENFHVASYDEIDASRLRELFTFDYILVKEGPVSVYTGQLCTYAGVGKAWECDGKILPMDKRFKVLLIGKNESEDLNVDVPFCKKRCYDARALIYNAPISWDYSQEDRNGVELRIKKGLVISGYLRPYGDGCFIDGSLKLCVRSGELEISFAYPDGRVYSVSAPLQMKYWNSFRATINPNVIALLVRQHGTDKVSFKYVDLGYKPVDQDKIGYEYDVKVSFHRISTDPYEWVEFTIESGKAEQPFCSEQIALCSYNALGVHAWTEENGKIYYGAFVARNIDQIQASSSLYRREGSYETVFNTGDLYVGNDPVKTGIIGYWISSDDAFGVYQRDYRGSFEEIKGFRIDYSTLTPGEVGFFRSKEDYPPYFKGFESNRKSDWIGDTIPYPALWEDEGLYYELDKANSSCQEWSGGVTVGADGKCYYNPDCGSSEAKINSSGLCEINLVEKCGIPGAEIKNGICIVNPSNTCPKGGSYDGSYDTCISKAEITCPDAPGYVWYDKREEVCKTYKSSRDELVQKINLTQTRVGECNSNGGYGGSYSGSSGWYFEGGKWVPYGEHTYEKVVYTVPFDIESAWFDVHAGYYLCEKSYGHDKPSYAYATIEVKKPGDSSWKSFHSGKLPKGTQVKVVYHIGCNDRDGCNIFATYGYVDLYRTVRYCPTGWMENGLYCQAKAEKIICPKGYVYDSSIDYCKAEPNRCPSGYFYDSSDKKCKKDLGYSCPAGYEVSSDGSACVKKPQCPTGAYLDLSSGKCVGFPKYSLPKIPEDIKITDDGIFKEFSPLCPEGWVELYQGDGKDFEGKCFTYKEKADCYKGSVNGLDEDRFGDYCYLQLKITPDVCPSDGRSYVVLKPPKADYVCETTRAPLCDSGDYRRGDRCYYQVLPNCPLPHGQLSGGTCKGWLEASCPSGYSLNTSLDRCVKTVSPYCPAGTVRYGGSCYYTADKVCPSGTTEQPDGRCKKNWCSEDSNASYCFTSKTCPSGYYSYGSICRKYATSACPSGYSYSYSYGSCIKTVYPSCSYGYSYNSYTNRCERTIDACSYEAIGRYGYSYDSLSGRCLKYKENACRNGSSFSDWSYDSSRDVCYYRTEAKCSSGERKRDPDSGWSACYTLEDTTVYYPSASKSDKGRIYCRNGYYYWKDRCYKLEGTACDGSYFSLKNSHELVIIGQGNSLSEWIGTCWKKIKDRCKGSDAYPLRGEFSDDLHCLKIKKKLTSSVAYPEPKEFAEKMCSYLSSANFGVGCNISWNSSQKHDIYALSNVKAEPKCPIDSKSACVSVGGEIFMCGTDKICIGCGEFAKLTEYPGYSIFKYVRYEGDKAYGMSWYDVPPTYVGQIVETANGRLPKKDELEKFFQLFSLSNPEQQIWYQDDPDLEDPEVKKFIGIVWSNYQDAGFLGQCVVDDNGDGLCTADMVECYRDSKGRLQCPYDVNEVEGNAGAAIKCQPYKGKYYCSRYSDSCRNLSDEQYGYQNLDTVQGANDKKNDGEVTGEGCKGTVYIFNGRDLRCRPPGFQTGFSDCCKKTKTWFGLGYCKESEKQLAALRSWGKLDGQCHYIGSYCAVKVFGICLQKKKTYCCFNSVLARIVQEQGRKQLGIDWGEPKTPNCRGFTPEEFQRIDFSKIDFSEWYEDLQKRIKDDLNVFKNEMPEKIKNYYENLQKY
ncbi:conjugal transfer protein TraN [Desulfurobacterium crinifex]